MRTVVILIVLVFVGLWVSSHLSNSKQSQKTEYLTYSQFKHMLTSRGRREIGTIYTKGVQTEQKKQASGAFMDFFDHSNPFVLQLSPRKISGRYLRPGNRIEKSDDRERIMERTIPFIVESLPGMISEDFLQKLEKDRIVYSFVNEKEDGFLATLFSILPIVIIIFLLWMFMMRQLQNTGNRALSFGKSKARLTSPENEKKIFFKDVAGCEEAKQELVEVVDFLKDPKKFKTIGAKVPRGVLLVGPPGTGKTLLARAVSGEASVPFYSISGSDFVEMFVGVGASRVRDLFNQAKRHAPCIIFIDEIDAVGRLRGAGLGGGHDEREQTLNQMLVEMDGFEDSESIIVVAATNRPDVLDPALLRPGRFDRQVVVDAPDVRGREAILKIHSIKVPMSKNVCLEVIARGTPGFTGADLANLINEAALLAARRNRHTVSMAEMEEAKDKVMMGPERRSFLITDKEKEVIAYHEGGHALLTALLPNAEPVHKVTIIPRGRALGLTQSLPEEDCHIQPKKYWEDRICVLMGGYLAEKLIFKDTSTGASNDIQVATKIARRMVCEWGMSKSIGTISYVNENENVFIGREMGHSRQYSDGTAKEIDIEIKRIVQTKLSKGEGMLKKYRKKVEAIAQFLLGKESITGEELLRLIGQKPKKVATPSKPISKIRNKSDVVKKSYKKNKNYVTPPAGLPTDSVPAH